MENKLTIEEYKRFLNLYQELKKFCIIKENGQLTGEIEPKTYYYNKVQEFKKLKSKAKKWIQNLN